MAPIATTPNPVTATGIAEASSGLATANASNSNASLKERSPVVLATAVHAFLRLSSNPGEQSYSHSHSHAQPADSAFDYIHRIVLATTAPTATLLLSLLYTQKLLNALRSGDPDLVGYFVDPTASKQVAVTQKVLSLWSLATVLSDTAMNATSWAQVTVFKQARVVAAWKCWAGELLDWDFDRFLNGGADTTLGRVCAENGEVAQQTHLHPSWTIDVQRELASLAAKQQQQLEQQQILKQQQYHRHQLEPSSIILAIANSSPQLSPTPPSNNSPMFPSRVSSLPTSRRSLPAIQGIQALTSQGSQSTLGARYSTESFASASSVQNSLPPIAPAIRSYYTQNQASTLQQRVSIPRLVIPNNGVSADLHTQYRSSHLPQPSYDSFATVTPLSTRAATPTSFRQVGSPSVTSIAETAFDEPVSNGGSVYWGEEHGLQRKAGGGASQQPSFRDYRDGVVSRGASPSVPQHPQQQQYQQALYIHPRKTSQPPPSSNWTIPTAPARHGYHQPLQTQGRQGSHEDAELSSSLSNMSILETSAPASRNGSGREEDAFWVPSTSSYQDVRVYGDLSDQWSVTERHAGSRGIANVGVMWKQQEQSQQQQQQQQQQPSGWSRPTSSATLSARSSVNSMLSVQQPTPSYYQSRSRGAVSAYYSPSTNGTSCKCGGGKLCMCYNGSDFTLSSQPAVSAGAGGRLKGMSKVGGWINSRVWGNAN
ncbi:hypothetical protein BC830DRAFT_1144679 [Chytriomyces sp. MP71]|nr:hypothetical protein BC830DRAFT_1144679 [Chytriomyces sp. MP71]